MCYGASDTGAWSIAINTGAEPQRKAEPPTRRRNPLRVVPADDRGYCSVCGADFAEYIECREGDCNWVRETKQSVPQVKAP